MIINTIQVQAEDLSSTELCSALLKWMKSQSMDIPLINRKYRQSNGLQHNAVEPKRGRFLMV